MGMWGSKGLWNLEWPPGPQLQRLQFGVGPLDAREASVPSTGQAAPQQHLPGLARARAWLDLCGGQTSLEEALAMEAQPGKGC